MMEDTQSVNQESIELETSIRRKDVERLETKIKKQTPQKMLNAAPVAENLDDTDDSELEKFNK